MRLTKLKLHTQEILHSTMAAATERVLISKPSIHRRPTEVAAASARFQPAALQPIDELGDLESGVKLESGCSIRLGREDILF